MATDDERPGSDDAQVLAFPSEQSEPGLRDVIGEVIRTERHQQGRTLVDVAREAAVSVQYLSEVERGRKEVSSDLLAAIHRALDLELVEVLERAAARLRVRPQRRGIGPKMLAA